MKLFIKLIALLILIFSLSMIYDRYESGAQKKIDVLQRIDPLPETLKLIKQDKYAEAAEYLGFFMQYNYVQNNPKAQELYEALKTKRTSMGYQGSKALEGVMYGKSDETIGQISAGVSDFFLFGDLRDLAIEGYHHFSGEEVDKVLVGLSTIGVIATGATMFSVGSAAALKGGISATKLIRKSGKMPLWMEKFILRSARQVKKTKEIKPVERFFEDIYVVSKNSGFTTTIKLLEKSSSMKAFHNSLGFAKTFGKNSGALFKVLGDDAVIYYRLLKDKVSKKVFLEAATYGKPGIKTLAKLGKKRFLKTLKPITVTSRLSKIFSKNVIHFFQKIPVGIYIVMVIVSLVLLI